MALTSKIMPYSLSWLAQYLKDEPLIASAFYDELIAIHHVGSTDMPGLAAKPEIDVLIEVDEHRNVLTRDEILLGLGYVRGSDLSEGHHFYRRNVKGVRTHKLHVCEQGHVSIAHMLGFRDLLKRNVVIRQHYQALKLELEASNTGGMAEYLARKGPFIIATMLEAGICAA